MRQLRLTPEEFIARIATFIPPPRKHRRHYYGAFASNSSMRARLQECTPRRLTPTIILEQTQSKVIQASKRWRDLIKQIYEVDPLLCNSCGGNIKILRFLTSPTTIHRILSRLDWPTQRPSFDDPDYSSRSYWQYEEALSPKNHEPAPVRFSCDDHHDPPHTTEYDPSHSDEHSQNSPHDEEIVLVYD